MITNNNLLLPIIFLSFISIFTCGTWLTNPDELLNEENRKLANLPKLSRKTITTFAQDFENYFNDRFLFRGNLVKTRNWLHYELWNTSVAPNILIGQNGWLYYLGENANILSIKENNYSKKDLVAWKDALISRTEYFAKRGIKYIFVVAPNKQSIYPEYYTLAKPKVNRLDQLTTFIKKYPQINFLNLKEPLVSNKNSFNEKLYFKTDTHWNQLGAFIADKYIALSISNLLPAISPLPLTNFILSQTSFTQGDCTRLMGLFGLIQEKVPILNSERIKLQPSLANPSNNLETVLNNNKSQNLPKAVVFHDSFGDGLKPFLNQHFSKVVYQLRQADLGLDLDLIAKEKPDIVIQEMVERHVIQLLPYGPFDWRHNILEKLQNYACLKLSPKETQWLCVLPYTNEINASRLNEIIQTPHSQVKATTCRESTNKGTKVDFDPNKVAYFQWYLTKTGEQGKEIQDPESNKNYNKLLSYVENSGKYALVLRLILLDGSELRLWRAKS